ncbi:MAG: tetratricopeptide repeat protein [Gemmatimonadota bacterium]
MIRFSTLGAIQLRATEDAEVQAILSQPMQVALLTYLVVARPRGFHRRDALLGLFWPELDTAHARGALNQAVYRLRGSLGREVVLGRGKEELGIDRQLVWSDVAAFECAVEEGSLREGLELYRGELLAGYFLSGAPAWERWLDVERGRLRHMASEAAWNLADDAAADRRQADTAYWGRRALALMPGDEAALRRLITLLDGIGDRAGAVRAYEEAAELYATEYETEPSPETQELIEDVRARDRPRERQVAMPASEPAADPGIDSPSALPAGATPPGPPASIRRSWRRRVLSGVAVVSLIGALLMVARDGRRDASAGVAGNAADASAAVDAAAPAEVRGTRVPEALTEYHRGVYHLTQLGAEPAHQARNAFQRALDLDPTFADAWSGLSASLLRMSKMSLVPADEAFPRARAAAERAIELDPGHGEAHALLARIFASYHWDAPGADSLFREALALAPNSAIAHREFARYLRNLGRLDEALVEIRTARELDPLFAFSHVEEGLIHYMARDYARAIEQYEILLRIAPEYRHVHTFIGLAQTQWGRYDEALAAFSRVDPAGESPVAIAARGYIYARTGRHGEARRMLDRLASGAGPSPVVDMQRALVHLGLGEHDRALDLLERGLEEPTWHMRLLKVEPFYHPIRSDPRFQAILRRVGLATAR